MAAIINLLITIPDVMLENEDINLDLSCIFTYRSTLGGCWGSIITPDQLIGDTGGRIIIGMRTGESPIDYLASWVYHVFNTAKLHLNYDSFNIFLKAFREEILPDIAHFFYPENNYQDKWNNFLSELSKAARITI